MNHILKKSFFALLSTFLFFGCSTSDKDIDPSKYENVDMETVQLFAPDASLKGRRVDIPSAKSIGEWQSSGGNLSEIPQNVLIKSAVKLVNKRTHALNAKFNKDYSFVGNTPIISNGKLVVLGPRSTIYAYDLSNLNKLVWEISLGDTEEDSFVGGGMFGTNGNLAVTHGSGSLTLLDLHTGKEKWQYKMNGISKTAPIIYKDRVFALTVDNKLYCLELTTGLLKWVNEGAAEQLGIIRSSSLVGHEDFVIVPYSVGQVYAVDISEGKPLWNLSLDDKFSSLGDLHTPIINEDIAYISSFRGTLFALNLKTGNVEWGNHYAGGNPIWVAGDYIFVANKNSQLAALEKTTGKVKWIQELPDDTVTLRPIIANKELFVLSSEGKLLVFSPSTGKKVRENQVAVGRYASPIAIQSGLYLLSAEGHLFVF